MDQRAAGALIKCAAVTLRVQPEAVGAGHGGFWHIGPVWRELLAGKVVFEMGAAAVLGG